MTWVGGELWAATFIPLDGGTLKHQLEIHKKTLVIEWFYGGTHKVYQGQLCFLTLKGDEYVKHLTAAKSHIKIQINPSLNAILIIMCDTT